jgi:mannose-6-phosphate isomerase-like protein (cupin superfamily)
MIIRNAASRAVFSAEKMGKVALAAGHHLYAGLNCFLPGQQHAAHVHADQDKLYVVLEGSGIATVGDTSEPVTPGDLVFAPAGVPHAMSNPGPANLIVATLFAPPPRK